MGTGENDKISRGRVCGEGEGGGGSNSALLYDLLAYE